MSKWTEFDYEGTRYRTNGDASVIEPVISVTVDGERKFPSYTTAQLKEAIAAGRGTPAMEAEVAARESGASTVRVTPQMAGGKVQTKLGRM